MASDPKLVWNPDNVRDVAESVGISSLNEEAVRALSQEVEYRVGQVIVEAMRFMHQGKRTVLGTQDISQALRVLDVEPLYGYESTRPLRFGEASLGPGQPLFYVEDEEIDFEKLINAPLPKVPRDMSFTGQISMMNVEDRYTDTSQHIGLPSKASSRQYPKTQPPPKLELLN
jgi:transcription initiation factor TFIID subunit 6